MIEEKKLKECESRVKKYIEQNIVKSKQKNEFASFFVLNSDKSLNSAKALYELSTYEDMQKKTGFVNFDGFLWVINASYYSMFYMVKALLENNGIKINSDLSIHLVTFDCLIYFFYLNSKLEKKFIEDFIESKEEASELLGKQKADLLIEDYFWEKNKRATFTYQTKQIILKSKAKTSLERAKRFNQEIKNIINTKPK